MIIYDQMIFVAFTFSDFATMGEAYYEPIVYDTEVPIWFSDESLPQSENPGSASPGFSSTEKDEWP